MGRTERRIFGDIPATMLCLGVEWGYNETGSYSYNPPDIRRGAPEVYEWLNANVGEEWVDWASCLDHCHGGRPNRLITVAFRCPVKALFALLMWGRVQPTLVYYEPWYSMMTKTGAPK